ncbi:hypothetical protein [Paracoccus onubensis]|uniref:Uncharacterized protein n=1 Tax=Paracoccus onubensis TaxID=1675788 RepID=A0A418T293_9RHOB|nr:hypothetical protein [Paracoccus onubensis]RJE87325.1 hypothetical protein D3P04_06220 [Paracoccus onubensis]
MNRLRHIAVICTAGLLLLALLSATSLRGTDTGRLGSAHISKLGDQLAVLVTTKANSVVFTAQRDNDGFPPSAGTLPMPPDDNRMMPVTWTGWAGPVPQAGILPHAPRAPPRHT